MTTKPTREQIIQAGSSAIGEYVTPGAPWDRLADTILALPAVDGWSDIASAPKDDTWVLCWGPDCGHGVAKFQPNPIWEVYPEYTHWMPLPASPDALRPSAPASVVGSASEERAARSEQVAAPASDGLRAALERAESDLHLVTLHGDVVGMHREAMAAKKRVRAALDQPHSAEGGE